MTIPDYGSFTWQTWAVLALTGMIGQFVRLAVTDTLFQLPERVGRGLRLHTFGLLAGGAAMGCLADHNPMFAAAAGATAQEVLSILLVYVPRTVKRAVNGALGKNGDG